MLAIADNVRSSSGSVDGKNEPQGKQQGEMHSRKRVLLRE
jgi:hypothetical protein